MVNSEIQYSSVEQLVESSKYPFTEPQLRHYLLHRHKNGLDVAVRKIGKRLYVRVDLFDSWIEKQKEGHL